MKTVKSVKTQKKCQILKGVGACYIAIKTYISVYNGSARLTLSVGMSSTADPLSHNIYVDRINLLTEQEPGQAIRLPERGLYISAW